MEKSDNLTFKDIYKPPYIADGVYLFATGDNHRVKAVDILYFTELGESLIKGLEIVLNGGRTDILFEPIKYDKGIIKLANGTDIRIRGWGYMKSKLNLSSQTMCDIQDNFAEWIFKKMVNNDILNKAKVSKNIIY